MGVLEEREVESLDVVEKELDDVRMESEDAGEGVVMVVKLKPEVVERSIVDDGASGVGEEPSVKNDSLESVGVKENGSETLVSVSASGLDVGLGLDGSIVMEESEGELEVGVLLNSVGRSVGEEISVKVSRNEDRSPIVNGSVSGGPTSEGSVSVIVGLTVWVTVGDELIPDDIKGVDAGKSVSVPVRNVGKVSSSLVEDGGIGGVKLKGGHLRNTAPTPPRSSSLIVSGERWAQESQRVAVRKGGSSPVQPRALSSRSASRLFGSWLALTLIRSRPPAPVPRTSDIHIFILITGLNLYVYDEELPRLFLPSPSSSTGGPSLRTFHTLRTADSATVHGSRVWAFSHIRVHSSRCRPSSNVPRTRAISLEVGAM